MFSDKGVGCLNQSFYKINRPINVAASIPRKTNEAKFVWQQKKRSAIYLTSRELLMKSWYQSFQ